jgi:cell division protein ZapA
MASEQLELTILGRAYLVACAPQEREALLACARFVDQKMRAIRDGGKVLGADRIAVLAALQITQEWFAARAGDADGASIGEMRRRLRELNLLADEMLVPQEKLF